MSKQRDGNLLPDADCPAIAGPYCRRFYIQAWAEPRVVKLAFGEPRPRSPKDIAYHTAVTLGVQDALTLAYLIIQCVQNLQPAPVQEPAPAQQPAPAQEPAPVQQPANEDKDALPVAPSDTNAPKLAGE